MNSTLATTMRADNASGCVHTKAYNNRFFCIDQSCEHMPGQKIDIFTCGFYCQPTMCIALSVCKTGACVTIGPSCDQMGASRGWIKEPDRKNISRIQKIWVTAVYTYIYICIDFFCGPWMSHKY